MEVQKCPLTIEEKQNMITEAAFLKSLEKARLGDPVADWLAAETEIEAALAAFCQTANREQKASAYSRLHKEVRRILEKAEETINAGAIKRAIATATAELRQVGEFFPETIDRASTKVRREISGTIEKLGHNWDNFRIKQSELLASWKEKGTHTLNQTTKSFYEWISRWRNRDGP